MACVAFRVNGLGMLPLQLITSSPYSSPRPLSQLRAVRIRGEHPKVSVFFYQKIKTTFLLEENKGNIVFLFLWGS